MAPHALDSMGSSDSSVAMSANVATIAAQRPETVSDFPSDVTDRLRQLGDAGDVLEPIAVIGMSLKFPQDATSPDAFWKMLTEGRCAMTEFPEDRINLEAFYHPDTNRLDTIPFRGGHFLKEPLGNFDAPFFSISSTEAASMDPQHRLLLETSYRALENAGIAIESASGTKTSVYTGCFSDDYKVSMLKDTETLAKYTATGGAIAMLAARLSWFFNLKGPCVNLDSACSSSMMALDLACQGLRNRDSNMALVAGANVTIGIDYAIPLSNMNFLSPDSRCYSFDHRGNGYGRGEGFGVVLLKRLSDALEDGDTIRAVVRSTGSNQDGRTPGITQPSTEAQETLIRDTYRKAGLSMQRTRYVEAHGTGTAVGDPAEAGAVGKAFQSYRSPEEPMYLGAVKSNIGHLEGASGIAGIIKTILVLESGVIPPNANFERINPGIDAHALSIRFPQENIAWPCKGLRRASVSSFGFGGSNSHAVLDDAYNYLRLRNRSGNHWTTPTPIAGNSCDLPMKGRLEEVQTEVPPNPSIGKDQQEIPPWLLVWSAADEQGTSRMAEDYRAFVSRQVSITANLKARLYMRSLAFTLGTRRSSLSWRSFAVANSFDELRDLDRTMSTSVRSREQPNIGFVFTGQGAQYAGMSAGLLVYSTYRDSLRKSEKHLYSLGSHWSLLDELQKRESLSNINRPDYTQPLCTALQIALVDLLRSVNIFPTAVLGHSSGEIAAAYCAGGLSHYSAIKVAFFRGKKAMQLSSSRHNGAMLSVALGMKDVYPHLQEIKAQFGECEIYVGCVNSPKNITMSGIATQIDALKLALDSKSIFCRKLRVNVAYHSPQMKDIADEYLASMGQLIGGELPSTAPVMISTVTGNPLSLDDLRDGDYWVKNLTSPVRFSDGLSRICLSSEKNLVLNVNQGQWNTKIDRLVEIGPHNALQGPIRETLDQILQSDIAYSAVMIRSSPSHKTFLHTLGQLYCSGYAVDVAKANRSGQTSQETEMVLPDLPEYPFNHARSYWHESRLTREGFKLRKYPRLDLLGTPVPDWNPLYATWRNIIRLSELPWLVDHKVDGTIVLPAAGMLVMALEASKQMIDNVRRVSGYLIKDAIFHNALTIPAQAEVVETQVHAEPSGNSADTNALSLDFSVCVRVGNQWNENCRGNIQVLYEEAVDDIDGGREKAAKITSYKQLYDRTAGDCQTQIDVEDLYSNMAAIGLDYGPSFQNLREIYYNDRAEAIAKVQCYQWVAKDNMNHFQPHVIHPTTLDSILQLMIVSLLKGTYGESHTMMLTRIRKLWLSSDGISFPSTPAVNVAAQASSATHRKAKAQLCALDPKTGEVLLSIDDLESTTVTSPKHSSARDSGTSMLCYNMTWIVDLDFLDNQQIQEYCERARPQRGAECEEYRNLDLTVVMYIMEALKALGDPRNPDQHMKRYIAWLEHQVELFSTGQLPGMTPQDPEWIHLTSDDSYKKSFSIRLECTQQGSFFAKVGHELPKILQHDVDPLAFMFQNDLIPDYYREINDRVICWEPLIQYLQAYSHKNPSMKVVEIGAGVGASTKHILRALGTDQNESWGLQALGYDYTDVSAAFFEAAKGRYAWCRPVMDFKILDIEKEPRIQGFEVGTYDLVFAASVIHATRNLGHTLRNVRQLLKPGGKLVMIEITAERVRTGFAFGLLPGWWLSEDQYRPWGPCVSTGQWRDLLRNNGFSGVDLEFVDNPDQRAHQYSIIVSTAVGIPHDSTSNPISEFFGSRKPVLLINEESALQRAVAESLKVQFESDSISGCTIEDFDRRCKASNRDFYIVLVEIENLFLAGMDAERFAQMQQLMTKASGLLWVTAREVESKDQPGTHLVDGLIRVARSEFNNSVLVTLALDSIRGSTHELSLPIRRVIERIASEGVEDFESEYRNTTGVLEIPRLVEASSLNEDISLKTMIKHTKMQAFGAGPPLALQIANPGILSSMQFVEAVTRNEPLGVGQLEIKVQATGANFRHCLIALGQLDSKDLGGECAGIVSRVGPGCEFTPGQRVAAIAPNTYTTFAYSPASLVMEIPDSMSYAEASALPAVFITAWYALCDVARLRQGESILIHAAAGGTGQAAIQVAKYIGAEIFVTVSSNKKRSLLINEYGILEDHIFYSRNTSFADGIMRMTKQRGVDVILNSLSGEKLTASWECIAMCGRFIELGKRDIVANNQLPMSSFRQCASFSAFDLEPLMQERPHVVSNVFRTVMDLITAGKFRIPQPFTAFKISEVEEVFRHFQRGLQIGKMAVVMDEDALVKTVLDTKPEYQFEANATYVIAGGFGGLGRSAARWMAGRGARYLVLLSRSGARSEAAIGLVDHLTANNVQVRSLQCDVSDEAALQHVLAHCDRTMPPIKGVIQGSMVLRDALLEKMTFEDWEASLAPKVKGSWNLHKLLPKAMDFFICLSSISGVVGSIGQANYAAANTYMDALVQHRIMQGEKAISLDLGWMASEGAAAESSFLSARLAEAEFLEPISPQQYHALLDHYCNPALGIQPLAECQVVMGLKLPVALKARGIDLPHWMQRRTFRNLHRSSFGGDSTPSLHDKIDYVTSFRKATSSDEASRVVTESLMEKLSMALSVPIKDLDASKPLNSYGVDSLLAVELRNFFANDFRTDLTVFQIMGSPSIEAISMVVAQYSQYRMVE